MSERWLARFAAAGRSARALAGVVFVALCLLMLGVGASPALCLDPRGECSPLSGSSEGSCHDAADPDVAPGCGSCVDVPLTDDSASRWSRPDDDLRAPAVAQQHAFASEVPLASSGSSVTTTPLAGAVRPTAARPCVLRI